MKTVKIEVPDGYEIDKEKSTFLNIVFKKKSEPIVKWNVKHNHVEIWDNDEHFVVMSHRPSFYCSWNDAMRYLKNSSFWKLPTRNQLKVLAKHIDKVNEFIRNHGGFEIESNLWSCEADGEFCAWFVFMSGGNAFLSTKNRTSYVRAVSVL